ncbi:exported hypothetical protein [Vibrio chagasii]|nr:exported hypothetical protein [Vibrio chagasii]
MRYSTISASVIALIAASSASALAETQNLNLVGDDISYIEVERVQEVEEPVYPQQSGNTTKFNNTNPIISEPNLNDVPRFYIGFGVNDMRGISDNINADNDIKNGASITLGLEAEEWDLKFDYNTASGDFYGASDVHRLGASALYRVNDDSIFKLKAGLGYEGFRIKGDNMTAVKDGTAKDYNSIDANSAFGALNITSMLSDKFSMEGTVKYHFAKDSFKFQFEDHASPEDIIGDISFDLGAHYKINDLLGFSFSTTFGSEFQKSTSAQLTIAF